ncbi:hypothetical protein LMG24235_01511 [Paraburkholderia sabiae]|nr:hypothetical protein LMG24235_01511 [Paraburkholderia sabiae]
MSSGEEATSHELKRTHAGRITIKGTERCLGVNLVTHPMTEIAK